MVLARPSSLSPSLRAGLGAARPACRSAMAAHHSRCSWARCHSMSRSTSSQTASDGLALGDGGSPSMLTTDWQSSLHRGLGLSLDHARSTGPRSGGRMRVESMEMSEGTLWQAVGSGDSERDQVRRDGGPEQSEAERNGLPGFQVERISACVRVRSPSLAGRSKRVSRTLDGYSMLSPHTKTPLSKECMSATGRSSASGGAIHLQPDPGLHVDTESSTMPKKAGRHSQTSMQSLRSVGAAAACRAAASSTASKKSSSSWALLARNSSVG
mmetsp:Transcript_33875/g.96857  ORF Transcript_33875/g.96857 Transcript_33875/m.96857 type:complete len:269 (+) Transcript_33875:944-1750(+)